MYWLQKRSQLVSLVTVLACIPSHAVARPSLAQNLQSGFQLAQHCEHEIDDDMTSYGECISHAMDRVAKQRQVLLGVHFQAWLMADLAARQNSTRALALRNQHAKALQRQLRSAGVKLGQLCEVKQISCKDVRERMAQQFESTKS